MSVPPVSRNPDDETAPPLPADGSVRSGVIFRNSLQNFLTQGSLLLLAGWGLPVLTSGLGGESFGILTILWAVVGYFSVLDLGTSRAVTRLVAQGFANGDAREAKRAVWAGMTFSAFIGTLTSGILLLITPFVVPLLAGVDESQASLIAKSFSIAAIGVPFMLVYGGIAGTFMAHQRFGPVNIFRAVLGAVQWIGAAILVWAGYGFLEIILLTVIARLLVTLAAFLVLWKMYPEYFDQVSIWDIRKIKELLSFGGWITISQIIGPFLLYADRFLIGSMLSVSQVAFYALPQEALSRVSILPLSLSMTLFPALSQRSERNNFNTTLYSRASLYLFQILLPVIFLLVVFAGDILAAWVGPVYQESSTAVFQIIAMGFLFNALAQVPVAGIHALGRPDISARFHMAELPIFLGLNFFVIPSFGIVGAALMWTCRVVADALLHGYAMFRLNSSSVHGLASVGIQTACALVLAVMFLQIESFPLRIVASLVIVSGYAWVVWSTVLDSGTRNTLKALIGRQ